MGVLGAVQWWEESQLRFLVLASLVIQYILLIASLARKFPIRSWFRPVIWLAYLGSDAIAIYALATLFNRHRKLQEDGHGHGSRNSLLEVLWAPILLIHLGGQDGITAYNIEDNELWTRHIFTTVSQVTVAVYVFWKSWLGGDTNLLIAAILLFILGILKCFEKPWALKRASINSLVSSGEPIQRLIRTHKLKIDPLEDFIEKAKSRAGADDYILKLSTPADFTPYKLFVDLASPSADDRIRMLISFSELDDIHAYYELQHWLSQAFHVLYTKENVSGDLKIEIILQNNKNVLPVFLATFGVFIRGLAIYLLFGAIALFHHSHREAYSKKDVKVTYALLCCTAVLEVFSIGAIGIRRDSESSEPTRVKPEYDDMVSQYNLISFLVRNKEHSKMMSIMGALGCSDFLHQHWCMKSCSSSFSITKLVLKYVKGGWEHHIRDVSSYRKFNDNRGQFTLQLQGCDQELGWSLEGAFDESVLLWHLATDFCYYDKHSSHHGPRCTQGLCPAWCPRSGHHKRAAQCREMSNYMMYLLFVNPEMLMAGTRRNLFTAAYDELKSIIIQEDVQPPNKLRQRIIAAMGGEGGSPSPDGAQQQQGEIIIAVDGEGGPPSTDGAQQQHGGVFAAVEGEGGPPSPDGAQQQQGVFGAVEGEGGPPPPDGTQQQQGEIIAEVDGEGGPPSPTQQQQGSIIHDAWSIAEALSILPEEKMWDVVEGVWVEMMCFSAARCRGYLHAKGLATGVEYLTYVWLLQYYMGMETLATKLQRVDYHHDRNGGEHVGDPSTCVSREATAQEQDVGPSSSGVTAEEKAADQGPYHSSDAIKEKIV